MGELITYSAKTFAKKGATFAAISLALLLTYTGVLGIKGCHENHQINSRTKKIEKAIKKEDLVLASQLYNSFKQKGLLKFDQEKELELLIKKEEGKYKLKNLMNLGTYTAISENLASLKKLNIYSPKDINILEVIVSGLSESGLM